MVVKFLFALVCVIIVFSRLDCIAQTNFDIISLVPPPDWKEERTADRISYTFIDNAKSSFCQLVFYASQVSSGDLSADLQNEWKGIIEGVSRPDGTPQPTKGTSAAGVAFANGGSYTHDKASNQYYYAHLILIGAGDRELTILIDVPTEASFQDYLPQIEKVMASIRFNNPTAPVQTNPTETAPLATVANSVNVKEATITQMAVGEWVYSTSSVLNYVSASGSYAGSSSVAYGERYTFRPDGTYTYSFSGISNRNVVREKDEGTFTITGNKLDLKGKDGKVKNFICWIEGKEGVAGLVLLNPSSFDGYNGINSNFYKSTFIQDKK